MTIPPMAEPMPAQPLHSWDVTTTEARDLQFQLAGQVDVTRPLPPWTLVAAADVSYSKFEPWLCAAVVVMRAGAAAGTFELVERIGLIGEARFPYVPGLLSFREAPTVLEAFGRLNNRPDVVLCDGQGYAHPRRVGLACHLGLWLDLPTIGCAKSWLCGEYDEPGPERGDRSPLIDKGGVVGSVVRTRRRTKPLFVSSGHMCDLDAAVSVVLATSPRYRLPVPARAAHDFVNEIRRARLEGRAIPT
jgi:deoxyribonuclease V